MAGQQVLIIEGNRELSHLLEMVLERQGYIVSYAADGLEGLRLQQRAPQDLVITDLFLGEMGGLEVISVLRAISPTVKIIAISGGHQGVDLLDMAQKVGADEVLHKPFTPHTMLAVVHALLSDSGGDSPSYAGSARSTM